MLPAHYQKKENNYFCRFTFGQFFTLLLLEIFTLFFIFYLGARYGRELLGMQNSVIAVEQNGGPAFSTTHPERVAVTSDPEIQALAKDLVRKTDEPDLKEKIAEILEKSEPSRAEPSKMEPSQTEPVVPPAQPAPLPEGTVAKPVEPVQPVEPAPAALPFTIQVGAYPTAEEADRILGRWKEKGYPAYVTSAELPGKGTWHRVRVGRFPSHDAATAYLDKFKQRENVEAFVAKGE